MRISLNSHFVRYNCKTDWVFIAPGTESEEAAVGERTGRQLTTDLQPILFTSASPLGQSGQPIPGAGRLAAETIPSPIIANCTPGLYPVEKEACGWNVRDGSSTLSFP